MLGIRIRWLMLGLAGLTMMSSYYVYDSIAPVASMLRDQRDFSQSQIGLLNAVFSLPNIALALVGGIYIDRIGAGRAIVFSTLISALGAVLTAIGEPFELMLLGRLLFGLGHETLYIALLVGVAQWFHLGNAALAMALLFSMARLGSYSADKSTSWFTGIYASGWQAPLWLAAGLAVAGIVTAIAYQMIDVGWRRLRSDTRASERLFFKNITVFSKSFWYILWLNVLFASVFFPFRSTFSIQYFVDVKNMSLADAGTSNSYIFASAIFATPLFGILADRVGKRATLLAFAASLLPVTFALLIWTDFDLWLSTALMGISFSIIPAVIWPSTAMLVEKHRVGTAFGVINMLQSLGLTLSNIFAGILNEKFDAGPENPDGYDAMLTMFLTLSVVAFISTVLLFLRERRQFGGGIEARIPRNRPTP